MTLRVVTLTRKSQSLVNPAVGLALCTTLVWQMRQGKPTAWERALAWHLRQVELVGMGKRRWKTLPWQVLQEIRARAEA